MAISADGVDALHRLKSTDPPVYLSPSPDLSQAARLASQQLFSSLKPFTPKSPFDRLLVDGFDAEQIWQQIDLQTQPLISTLRREVKKLEKNPEELLKLFGEADAGKPEKVGKAKAKAKAVEKIDNGVEDEDNDLELDLEDFNEDEDDEEESENEGEEDEEDREKEAGDHVGVEDKFLKINELEEYLEDDEAREYGTTKKKTVKRVENEDEEDDEEDDDDDEFGLEEDDEEAEDVRYEDFFGDKKKDKKGTPYSARKESDKKTDKKRRPKWIQEVNDLDVADEKDDEMTDKKRKSKLIEESDGSDSGDEEDDEMDADNQKNEPLSTHEKNLQKQRSKIEEMEKANMEPKTWTMQGEITAAKRPKDSALEVVLDYQRNVKAAPVITEEVTESLEDLIQKRISEGNFDDIHRAPSLPSKAPREVKELDENKSKKGLGEIYADEYVQKTGLVSAALSFSDEQKKESSVLFKRLCLKLDALSHFHFTPKPVIEDMSIQVNVPALAMEEIAPLAVSDAAMLAPEEVFSGKGDIKEEAELTQAERKRRRANKKRKFKATTVNKMAAKKARESKLPNVDGDGQES